MRTKLPLVSVVIPSYNHAPFIAQTIDSVLAQTVSGIELIIIDDGSRDDSAHVIEGYLDRLSESKATSSVQFIHRSNRGLCRTLNEGLAAARGTYFAYLGSDDLWEPQKLERQLTAMEAGGASVGASFTDCYFMDEDGRRFGVFSQSYPYRGGDIYEDLVWWRFQPPSPTNLFVREKLIEIGGFNEKLALEDYDIWLRYTRHNHVAYVTEPLASFRLHTSNASMNYPERMIESSRATIEWAFANDPSIQPLRRKIEARHRAVHAAMHYNVSNLPAARRKALGALRVLPFDLLAWRTLACSLLSPYMVKKLRELRRQRGMSREQQDDEV